MHRLEDAVKLARAADRFLVSGRGDILTIVGDPGGNHPHDDPVAAGLAHSFTLDHPAGSDDGEADAEESRGFGTMPRHRWRRPTLPCSRRSTMSSAICGSETTLWYRKAMGSCWSMGGSVRPRRTGGARQQDAQTAGKATLPVPAGGLSPGQRRRLAPLYSICGTGTPSPPPFNLPLPFSRSCAFGAGPLRPLSPPAPSCAAESRHGQNRGATKSR